MFLENISLMLDIVFNSIIPFVIILTILVFVHELGHYLAAIKNNVKVEVFSIGFGKELFGLLIIQVQDGNFSLTIGWLCKDAWRCR